MKSRTSFFNATVLRKDITRFLPVWLLYLIGSLIIGPENITYVPSNYFGWGAKELSDSIATFALINPVYAFVCAQMLFGDLFKSRLCNAMHAMPLRRECWFVTHCVSGLLFSLVPNAVMCLIYLPFMDGMWYVSLFWLLAVTLQYIFFFGLSALCAICAGNRLGMSAMYAIVNFLALIVRWFVWEFYVPNLYGLHLQDQPFEFFCPILYLGNHSNELIVFDTLREAITTSGFGTDYRIRYLYLGLGSQWWYPVLLAAIGVGLMALAIVLYRRRKLESAGDLIAFAGMKPVFTVIFTLCCGALGHLFADSFFLLVVGILVGFFVCRMLMERTVKVFRKQNFLLCGGIVLALVASIALSFVDPLGITRWVPDPEDVDSVVLSSTYHFDIEEWDEGNFTNAKRIDNPQLIRELTEAHRQILTEEPTEKYDSTTAIHLSYCMNDGRIVHRRYYCGKNSEAARILDEVRRSPEYIMGYQNWEQFLAGIDGGYANWDYDLPYSAEEARELAKAIKADCESSNMAQTDRYDFAGSITLTFEDDSTLNIQYFESSRYILQWINNYGKETPKGA